MRCPKTGEVVVKIEGGGEIRSGWIDKHDPDALACGDYLKLLDGLGREVFYAGADEFLPHPAALIHKLLMAYEKMQSIASRPIGPLKIKRFLRDGEIDVGRHAQTIADVLTAGGHMLDKITGDGLDVVFEAEDGRFYTAGFQVVIDEADPDFIRDLLDEGGV